jgi:hypothetical protein
MSEQKTTAEADARLTLEQAAPMAAGLLGQTKVSPPEGVSVEAKEPIHVPPSEPAGERHNPALVAMARELGIPDSEIQSSSTNELMAAVRVAQRFMLQAPRQESGVAEPPPPPEIIRDWGRGADGQPLQESDYAPNMVTVFRQLSDAIKERDKAIVELTARLESVEQGVRQQRSQSVKAQLDGFFARYPALFGQTAEPGTPEHDRRLALVELAKKYYRGDAAQAAEQAFRVIYGGQADAARPTKQQWMNAAAAPVNGGSPANAARGREAAIAALKELMRQREAAGPEIDVEKDFLPPVGGGR